MLEDSGCRFTRSQSPKSSLLIHEYSGQCILKERQPQREAELKKVGWKNGKHVAELIRRDDFIFGEGHGEILCA